MILPNTIALDAPSRLAAEGELAKREGDLVRASDYYRQAGEQIEKSTANVRKQSEKHYLRFLAASQYYHGGHYEKALALGRKIEARFLSGSACSLFPQFMKDATSRAKPDYVDKTRRTVARLWKRAEYQAIIELFQQHPYILPAPELAATRALCCERLKDYRTAALFFEDAVRMSSQRPDIVFLSVSYAYSLLLQENKLADAKEYLAHLVQKVPHALTFAGASLLRHFEAAASSNTIAEMRNISEEQIQFFEKAVALYKALPVSHRNDPNFRNSLAEAAAAAAIGFVIMEQRERALEVCDWAAELSPDLPGPKKMREEIVSGVPIEGASIEDGGNESIWITKAREDALRHLLPAA